MKVKFGNSYFELEGKQLQIGDKIDFRATKNDFKIYDINKVKGKKVISVVPSLDTSVCSLQTTKIAKIQQKYSNVNFITISMDLPFAQARWCGAHSKNVLAVSDYKEREFGKSTGFLIPDLALLARGLVILDENNTVLAVQYVKKASNEPDYDLIEKTLN